MEHIRIRSVFKSILLILVVMVGLGTIVGSSGAPPAKYSFQSSVEYDKSFDEVWEAIIASFAASNIPIKTIEKNSGIIVSDEMKVPFTIKPVAIYESDYCDCGSPQGLTVFKEMYGSYNIFVRRFSSDRVSVQINTLFKAIVGDMNHIYGSNPCNSKGFLEAKLLKEIELRLR